VNARARRQQICDLLRIGPVEVGELAARFEVTESTIRRDLAKLTDGGEIIRTYGGALAAAPGEQSVYERQLLFRAEKEAIAVAAAAYVRAGQLVLLDAGTTIGLLAERLSHRSGITVATTGLTALNALADAAGVELIALGGAVRHVSLGMIGPLAERALAGMTVDAAFLGADGVMAGRGMCEATAEQAALKQQMVAHSTDVFVLADHSKLGRASAHWWTRLDRRWTLVTDGGATEADLAPFHAEAQCTVVVA
jgi:DeoR/GlpR family transcriptional regulator of sugar metabolism